MRTRAGFAFTASCPLSVLGQDVAAPGKNLSPLPGAHSSRELDGERGRKAARFPQAPVCFAGGPASLGPAGIPSAGAFHLLRADRGRRRRVFMMGPPPACPKARAKMALIPNLALEAGFVFSGFVSPKRESNHAKCRIRLKRDSRKPARACGHCGILADFLGVSGRFGVPARLRQAVERLTGRSGARGPYDQIDNLDKFGILIGLSDEGR